MIDSNVIDAFKSRPRVDLNTIKTMTPREADRVKVWGTQAENLLTNRDFAMFVHQFKFEMTDALTEIKGHTVEDNAQRVSIAHQLAGVEEFVKLLKRARYFRDRVVTQQQQRVAEEPNPL